MKICPNCRQTYADENLNFCLNDGSMLSPAGGNEPKTIYMDQSRVTAQNWPNNETAQPPGPWGGPQNMQTRQPNGLAALRPVSTTLPTISLILGIAGLLLFCCHGGIPLGAGAIITGLVAINQEKANPDQYGGRGLAIGGVATGAVAAGIGLIFIFIAILGSLT